MHTMYDLSDQYGIPAHRVAIIARDNVGVALLPDEDDDMIGLSDSDAQAVRRWLEGPHTLVVVGGDGHDIDHRPATRAQVVASYSEADTGQITIDEDGDIVHPGEWHSGATHTAYVI